MRGVWVFVLLLVFSLTFSASSVCVSAQSPEVTILPEVISVNSPLLVKVDPKTTEKPIRITWSVYNTGQIGLGSFPIVDGKGLCYFSNTDGNATCGPSPFFQTGETELYVYVITSTSSFNTTKYLNVSSLTIPMGSKNVEKIDNTIYMRFSVEYDWMKYSIWREDLTTYQSERGLVWNSVLGRYEGNITLNPGVYYFTFLANSTGQYAGALKRIDIPSGDFLIIDTNKDEYWTGEKITISGKTNSDSVTGTVYFPDGKKARDFSTDVEGDQTFSYEFLSKSDWPEGEYEIKIDYPIVRSVKFSIIEFFEVTPESVSKKVNKSEDFETIVQLKNLRTNATNVSLSTSGDMKDEYITIDDILLSPLETSTITIQISDVETSMEGEIIVETPEGLQLSIPVSITVTEEGECPPCEGGEKVLEVDEDYLVWSQECVAAEDIYNSVLLINNGDSELSDFVYLVEDTYTGDQSLESLDSYGYIDISVYDFSLNAGDSDYLEMKITPASAGKYQGMITIKSGGNSAFIFVDLNCFDDMSADLESLGTQLYELTVSEDIREDLSYDITEAQNQFSLGNYKEANEYYQAAKAKIEILESGGVAPPPMDLTWVIVVVIIVIVVLVVVWFLKFKRPQISRYEEETEDLEGF